jgi:hypothetical protein
MSIIQNSGNNSGENKVEASDQSRGPQEPSQSMISHLSNERCDGYPSANIEPIQRAECGVSAWPREPAKFGRGLLDSSNRQKWPLSRPPPRVSRRAASRAPPSPLNLAPGRCARCSDTSCHRALSLRLGR